MILVVKEKANLLKLAVKERLSPCMQEYLMPLIFITYVLMAHYDFKFSQQLEILASSSNFGMHFTCKQIKVYCFLDTMSLKRKSSYNSDPKSTSSFYLCNG